MKCVVELSRSELEEAIREYLLKNGYCLSDHIYGTPLTFELGDIDVGTQREPSIVRTVTKVLCVVN